MQLTFCTSELWYYTTNKEEYNQMTIYYCCSFVIHVLRTYEYIHSRKARTKTTDIRQEHYAAVHHDNSSHDTEVLASYICTVSTSTSYRTYSSTRYLVHTWCTSTRQVVLVRCTKHHTSRNTSKFFHYVRKYNERFLWARLFTTLGL